MFRISFFVDDKNLGEAFKRLAGVAKNVEHVYVPNVESKPTIESKPNGKLHMSADDAADMFVKAMRKRRWAEVDAERAREIVGEMGFSPTSYSYLLQKIVAAGLMTKKKKLAGKGSAMTYVLKAEK